MKALFTLLCLPFFLATTAYSQSPDSLQSNRFQPFVSAAMHGGINISSLNNFNGSESRIGLIVGLSGEYRFSDLLGISGGLNYSQQGTNYQHTEIGMNYLKFPVLLNLHDNDFTVQAGAYGAVLLKARTLYGQYTEDVTKRFRETETGLCLGMSYNFFGGTFMGLHFYRGLQNVNKTMASPRLQFRNSTVQITGGYTF